MKYNEKNYCLSNIPSKTDSVVIEAGKAIEGQLQLQYLGKDLSRLGWFIRITYYSVVGHADLQIEVRTCIRKVFELCHNTAHTLNDFKRNSQEALEILQTAYRYLDEALEDQALKMLINLQEVSKDMKNVASNLSMKCQEHSDHIKRVGDTTIRKRADVLNEKESNEGRIKELEEEEDQTREEIKEDQLEKQKVLSDLQFTDKKEEEVIRELKLLSEENQLKSQEFHREMQQNRDKLTRNWRNLIEKVKMACSDSIAKNEQNYSADIQTNKAECEASELSATKEYEIALERIKNNYTEKLELNEKWLKQEQQKIKRVYDEAISNKCKPSYDKITEIENHYKEAISDIECNLKANLSANEATLNEKLKQNEEELDATLKGYSAHYELKKKKTWFWQTGERLGHDMSKVTKDVDAKKIKSAADNEARNARIKDDEEAEVKASDAKRKACESKEAKAQHYREEIHKITEQAFIDLTKSNCEIDDKKKSMDEAAVNSKQQADTEAAGIKSQKVSEANIIKKSANKQSLEHKNKLTEEAKSVENEEIQTIEKEYQVELEKLERAEEDFKRNMKLKSDVYSNQLDGLKQKEIKSHATVQELERSKKSNYKKMRNVIEQLMQCKSQSDIQKMASDSLQEAVSALNEIEAVMKNAGEFWKQVEGLCQQVTGRKMKTQVDMLSGMEPHDRKLIWKSNAFKVDALNFYGKWIALKEACSKACENVISATDEVCKYMIENPNEDEAFKHIQEMGSIFLKELQD